jgi:hypothetical protein
MPRFEEIESVEKFIAKFEPPGGCNGKTYRKKYNSP